MLDNTDRLSEQIAALDTTIEQAIAPFASQVAQLDEVTGVGITAAQELIAELGVDMGRFPSAAHLLSWAKFCPQTHESAGKHKPKGRGKGNPWLAGTLGNIVATAARTDRFLGRATGGSPNAAASRRRWSRSATRSWSSSTTCCPTRTPDSVTWAPSTTTRASTSSAGRVTSPPSSRPSPASES